MESTSIPEETSPEKNAGTQHKLISPEQVYGSGESTIEEMDRMRKLIADHMVYSKQTAPHVTSFVESDVTVMMSWRERVKEEFLQKYNQKLTITTLIMEAVARTLKEFPGINVSLDGYRIIRKSSINIGMATALPGGNLIVPVIRNADQMNLAGMAAAVNAMAGVSARSFTVEETEKYAGSWGDPVVWFAVDADRGAGRIGDHHQFHGGELVGFRDGHGDGQGAEHRRGGRGDGCLQFQRVCAAHAPHDQQIGFLGGIERQDDPQLARAARTI